MGTLIAAALATVAVPITGFAAALDAPQHHDTIVNAIRNLSWTLQVAAGAILGPILWRKRYSHIGAHRS